MKIDVLSTVYADDGEIGYVAITLDKLPGIRGDLVRKDPLWENWTFDKLTEALRLWTRRNPIIKQDDRHQQDERNRRK